MERTNHILLQIGADLVFFLTLNMIGFYVKYVSEINMRRGFLDKRSCIETTFKLKYEKEQEVSRQNTNVLFNTELNIKAKYVEWEILEVI